MIKQDLGMGFVRCPPHWAAARKLLLQAPLPRHPPVRANPAPQTRLAAAALRLGPRLLHGRCHALLHAGASLPVTEAACNNAGRDTSRTGSESEAGEGTTAFAAPVITSARPVTSHVREATLAWASAWGERRGGGLPEFRTRRLRIQTRRLVGFPNPSHSPAIAFVTD